MLQRTMAQKENIEQFYDQVIAQTEALEQVHNAAPRTSSELRKEKESAHKMSVIQAVPEIARILARMNVAFLCAKEGSFITSDTPCFLFNPELQGSFYGPGLGQKHVEVRMALSPELTVSFTWANNLRGYLKVGQDWVHEFNRMTFGHSHEYFVANSPKLKRRWFQRFPIDPIFLGRIVARQVRRRVSLRHRRHKQHV
jgi:hypothetical protein